MSADKIRAGIAEVEAIFNEQLSADQIRAAVEPPETVHLIEDTETDSDQFNAVRPAVKIRVAMDSGACKSVAHPSVMPSGVVVTPHTGGKHFSGAGGKTNYREVRRVYHTPEWQTLQYPGRLESG